MYLGSLVIQLQIGYGQHVQSIWTCLRLPDSHPITGPWTRSKYLDVSQTSRCGRQEAAAEIKLQVNN